MIHTGHETGSPMVNNDCKAQLMIDEQSIETNSNGTSVKCKMSVLAATDYSQVGRTVTEFFKVDGKAAGMFLNVAEAAGLITREQRLAAQQAGEGLSIDETLLKGRQIAATIKMKPNLRKNPVTGQNETDPDNPGPYPRIGFDTYSIWDQKAKDIPLDMQFTALMPKPAGYEGSGRNNPSSTSSPSQQTPPPAKDASQSGGFPPTDYNW